ncbi:MAG: type II secretion system F family protein, partial [Actinomycetes bacterium]
AATLTYQYSVRDRQGRIVTGKLEADSPSTVAQKLRSMGYAPVSISQHSAGMKTEIRLPSLGSPVKLKDLAVLSRQFATMISSGLSLLRALSILENQTENKVLAKTLTTVRTDVETGVALSTALAKHPKIFPAIMINMCRAGEVGGFLDAVLVQLAENFEADNKLRGKVKSAMTYPVVVFVMAIIAVTIMLIFVVPVFAKMFSQLGGQLPAPTRLLVILSGFLKVGIIPLIILAIIGFMVWSRTKHLPQVRNVVDPIKLKTPIFGQLFQKIALSRFTRNLGMMIRSGVPILQALDIVADTAGNVVIGRAVRDVQNSVRNGESLSKPLETHPIFPAMVVQMMSVGEDTGALDQMLLKISDFYDQEVESTTEALTSLIEPLMIAVLGGIIGSMIVALYLPIFNIYNLIK